MPNDDSRDGGGAAASSAAACSRMGPLTATETALLLSDFPPVAHAIAYGSAVFAPQQYTASEAAGAMTDLVFAVRDPLEWHRTNLARHPQHYSALGYLGPRAVAAFQERVGACVYYNAFVPWRGRVIKYGVVSVDALVDDLSCWSKLYLAGRMHKPVQTLATAPEVEAAAQSNLRSALAAALLMQPCSSFAESELFATVCSLSYAGDPRQALVESAKPLEIATRQTSALRDLYAGPLRSVQRAAPVTMSQGETPMTIPQGLGGTGPAPRSAVTAAVCDTSAERRFTLAPALAARAPLLLSLPSHARAQLVADLTGGRVAAVENPSDDALLDAVRHLYRRGGGDEPGMRALGGALRSSLGRVVRRSSTSQTLKGVLTGGVVTTVRYVAAKLGKQLRR